MMEPSATALLDWYDRHARALPWRVSPADRALGVLPDPYGVWLSEVMLQQTTVAAVKDYFRLFVTRWPTVADLAAADRNDVMAAWAGLGYYSRARNLKACAEMVCERHDGRFPQTVEELEELPGIGPYTAAAIAAIAFDQPETVVDGNVERVMTRLHAIETPLPIGKPEIRARAAALTPPVRPGDYAQAVMDLGATICTPRSPACGLCPWQAPCKARLAGTQTDYPRKVAKPERPTRFGRAYVAVREDGAILCGRRPDKGLLGGMLEVPGSVWGDGAGPSQPPLPGAFRLAGEVEHTFTHFHLRLTVEVAQGNFGPAPSGLFWLERRQVATEAFPSVMRKVLDIALQTPGRSPRRKGLR